MKYLCYIIAIVLLATAAMAYLVADDFLPEKTPALLAVNDYALSPAEFEELRANTYPYPTDPARFTNELIDRILLIQEAKRQHLDQLPSFRNSIRNYYEQSLIRLLSDEQCQKLDTAAPEEAIDRYLALYDKQLLLTRFTAASQATTTEPASETGVQEKIFFFELADSIKHQLLSVDIGERTAPLETPAGSVVFRFDGIEEAAGVQLPLPTREEVRKNLVSCRLDKALEDWLDDLRKKARITINTNS